MFTWSIPTNSRSTILKVNNRNNRNSSEKCETCSKLAIRTPEQRHWNFFSERNHRSKAFKVMESHPHLYLEDFEIYPRYSTVSFSRKWNWINLSPTTWKRRYTPRYRIQSECGKMRTRKNSVFGHFSHNDDQKLHIRFASLVTTWQ